MTYPILFGTMASALAADSALVHIETISLGQDQGAVSFTTIPQTFKSLQVRLRATNDGTLNTTFYMQINGNNTTNDWATLQAVNNSVSGTNNQQNGPAIYFGGGPGGSNLSYRQNSVIEIPDYKSYGKSKSLHIHTGTIQNGTGSYVTSYTSAIVQVTTPITGIAFGLGGGGGNIKANSKISLYGIR